MQPLKLLQNWHHYLESQLELCHNGELGHISKDRIILI